MSTIRKLRVNDDAVEAIRNRETFTNQRGSLSSGYAGMLIWMSGDLDMPERKAIREAFNASGGNLYVVKSYDTPIAWVTPDGAVTIPEVRYSQTTTQHQLLAAYALGVSYIGWGPNSRPRRTGRGHTPYTPRYGY